MAGGWGSANHSLILLQLVTFILVSLSAHPHQTATTGGKIRMVLFQVVLILQDESGIYTVFASKEWRVTKNLVPGED